MRKTCSGLMTFVLLLTASGAVRAQADAQKAAGSSSEVEKLRPGDVVRVRIWREPDLSGDFAVDDRGIVVLPKVGPYTVLNETALSLQDRLIRELSQYLRNPSIDVVVLRRVQIVGAVHRPGLYTLEPTMSVGDALALAGGAAPDGRRDRIELLRDGQSLSVRLSEDIQIRDTPIRSGDQIFVPQRRWLTRPSFMVPLATGLLGILVAVAFR